MNRKIHFYVSVWLIVLSSCNSGPEQVSRRSKIDPTGAIKNADATTPGDNVTTSDPSGDLPASELLAFDKDILPIMQRHCLTCHSQAAPTASFDLSSYEDNVGGRTPVEKWTRVVAAIESESMPPASMEAVSQRDLTILKNWLAAGAPKSVVDDRLRPKANNLAIELTQGSSSAVHLGGVVAGLKGEYFDNPDLTALVGARIDETVNFCSPGAGACSKLWSNAANDFPGVNATGGYSERWTGEVYLGKPGTWTFYVVSDDGVRLFVDDKIAIDNWTNHAATEDSVTIDKNAGWHSIRLEHYQVANNVAIQLFIEGPDTPKQIVSKDRLRTAPLPDPSALKLEYAVVTQPTKGVISQFDKNTGRFTYTADAGAIGTDTLTYKVNDGKLDSLPATVAITIVGLDGNRAPVAVNSTIAASVGMAVNGTLVATDADNEPLTYAIVTQPTSGTLSLVAGTGAFVYTASANATISDTFTFRASDGRLNSNTATVTVSINNTNAAPVAQSETALATQGLASSIKLKASDPDNNPLTYIITMPPTAGAISALNASTGDLIYTPNANAPTVDTFRFKVNDGKLDSNIATITVNIRAIQTNIAPVAANSSLTVAANGAVSGMLNASDAENNMLTFTIVGQPTKGTISNLNQAARTFLYTAAANQSGADSFTFRANDGNLNSNLGTVSITITPPAANRLPVAANGMLGGVLNAAIAGQLTATDADGDALSYTVVMQPTKGTISNLNANTGAYVYTGSALGADSFTFRANDGKGNSNVATVAISVTGEALTFVKDVRPIMMSACVSCHSSTPGQLRYGFLVLDTYNQADYPDGNNAYRWGRVLARVNAGTMPPPPAAALSATQAGIIDTWIKQGMIEGTAATNRVPVAANLVLPAGVNVATNGALSASDADGDALTYAIVAQPVKGTLSNVNAATGTFTYRSNVGASGTDSFTFRAGDGKANSNTATVTINLVTTNSVPVAAGASLTATQGVNLNGKLTATDADGNALTYLIVRAPAKGSITDFNSATGAFSYQPISSGADSFMFKVNDGQADSGVATININIAAVTCSPTNDGRTILQRLSKTEYENTLKQILGITTVPSSGLPADPSGSDSFDNNAGSLTLAPDYLAGYLDANKLAITQALNIANTPLLNCALGAAANAPQDAACVRRLMTSFVLKAYRRPASTDELDRLVAVVGTAQTNGGTFRDGINVAMQSVLASPNFIYRYYGTGGNLLGGYEMATRLAYFLWNSPPDQVLLDLAAAGTLNTPTVLQAQVQRMMADPKMDLFAENFSGQWLSTRNVLSSVEVSRSPTLFPEFTTTMRSDMKRETDLFFSNLIKNGGSAFDLLNGNYSYINENLATLYGINGVTGAQFRRVDLAGTRRKGVTTQASVLTNNASAIETSPTRRGYWILKKLTCNQPPPVPPGLEVMSIGVKPGSTLKELMAEHRNNPACSSCHVRMDPVGTAFEHFGAIGKYRTVDSLNNPIDASGMLPDGQSFADHQALIDILVSDPAFPTCITKKVLTYAVGRQLSTQDQCVAQSIAETTVKPTGKFSDLILQIVLSNQFRRN